MDEFHDMELNGILQSESDIDLFCLHFVGMNLFQRTLQGYVASWNNHPMRTKGNKTPIQLYISGLASLKDRQNAGEFMAPCAELMQDPGVLHLPEGIFDSDYLESIVGPFRAARDVPKYDCPLVPVELDELIQLIDPTKNSKKAKTQLQLK
ncbi:hypothetical protein DAPPUDRAFT_320754 [Daphnia pulex]|uniref:Integrase core domain-containing protein n=1 Tax=Daphnia pulex TaxID=6669 RepID=E9GQ63_DAPPU|nr:hypothetical protein DAPPUDRAFT_320754 [Daphnia pulex]|eukprot:EFX78222.1 hypothetical protein DAPPUDRAFT_320754 [Daphnia pulex]